MPEIVVNDQQAQIIFESQDPVQVRDGNGRVLGFIARMPNGDESVEIREMLRRMQTEHRSFSTEDVIHHLRSLDTK